MMGDCNDIEVPILKIAKSGFLSGCKIKLIGKLDILYGIICYRN
jgi:hypothetical protein